jgi:Outer membrane protein beta-barrel domain
MKKMLLVVAATLFFAATQAQIGFGPKGGLNSYALSSNVDDKSFVSGPHFGIFSQINITEQFSIQPELVYSKQGNGYETNGVKESTSLDYLNVPIMLQFNTKSGFSFEVGPELGFLMSAKYKEDGTVKRDVKQSFKGTNFSVGLGLVYRMKMGLGFGFRYNMGLSNVSSVANTEAKSTGGQLGISYKFQLSKKK